MFIRLISIGKRSTIAFAIVGFLVLFIGVFTLNRIAHLSEEFDVVTEQRVAALSHAQSMQASFFEMRFQAVKMVLYPDQRQALQQDFAHIAQGFGETLKSMNSLARANEAKHIIDEVQSGYQDYVSLITNITQYLAEGKAAESAPLQDQAKVAGNKLTKALEGLGEFQTQRIRESASLVKQTEQETTYIMYLVIVVALSLVMLFSVLFTRSLVQPLNVAIHAAENIANGNLTTDFADAGRDESAQMVSALAAMQVKLRATINDIQMSSAQLAATSEELSVATNQSTQFVYEQNLQLEQAVSAVTQLSSAVDEVARNAGATSQESEVADERADTGQREVDNTFDTVNNLLGELNNTIAGVSQLEEQVGKIGSVLDVIRDIAEQTNLLALNAAIEAARAGESGRGFAVVADEVRALAHRTHESTIEIENMISSVQGGTDKTVNSIRSSHERTKVTLEIAQRAGDALREIKQAVSNIYQQNTAIASAAEEQASVSREVDEGLTKIRDIASNVAAAADQSSSSSQEMASLADSLKALTIQFRV